MAHHLHNFLHLSRVHVTELREMYVSLIIRMFVSGMLGVFIPIYLYNLDYSLFQIALFKGLIHVGMLMFFPLSGFIILRFGAKHSLIISYLLSFLGFGSLALLPANPSLFFVTATILFAFGITLFWTPQHYKLAAEIDEKSSAKQVGIVFIGSKIATSLGPFVGGMIATWFGTGWMFVVGLLLIGLAIYPLLLTKDDHESTIKFSDYLSKRKLIAPKNHLLANFGMNTQGNITVFMWPLFIYLFLDSYALVGAILSGGLILSVLLVYLLHKYDTPARELEKPYLGSKALFSFHGLRTIGDSTLVATGVSLGGEIMNAIFMPHYLSVYYLAARKSDRFNYVLNMEIVGTIAKAVSWFLVAALSLFLSLKTVLIIAFVIAALVSPLISLIFPKSSQTRQDKT